jgi:hypothetical protein
MTASGNGTAVTTGGGGGDGGAATGAQDATAATTATNQVDRFVSPDLRKRSIAAFIPQCHEFSIC